MIHKFRGLTREGKWVYGYYLVIGKEHYICNQDIVPIGVFQFQSPDGSPVNAVSSMFSGLIEVIPATVGMFINKHDNNKQEIYAGDICKNGDLVQGDMPWVYRTEEVKWDEANAMWVGWNGTSNGMSCKVIGTIHEGAEND